MSANKSADTVAKLKQQMAAIIQFNRDERKKREQQLQLRLQQQKRR